MDSKDSSNSSSTADTLSSQTTEDSCHPIVVDFSVSVSTEDSSDVDQLESDIETLSELSDVQEEDHQDHDNYTDDEKNSIFEEKEKEKEGYEDGFIRQVRRVATLPPKPNSLYLPAGLYASIWREEGSHRIQMNDDNREFGTPAPENTESFRFLLPKYFGEEFYFEEENDFELPFDIHCEFDIIYTPSNPNKRPRSQKPRKKRRQSSLKTIISRKSPAIKRRRIMVKPKKVKIPKAKYKHISHNKFIGRQKFPAEVIAVCTCTENCSTRCLNRDMQYLCSLKHCPSGDKCTNLPFDHRVVTERTRDGKPKYVIFWTGTRGHGLKAAEPIKSGEFVIDYRGEVIPQTMSYERVQSRYLGFTNHYFLDYDTGEVIDAGTVGNEARFINHSCNPNLLAERWRLADYDEYQIGLFALRDIEVGEELTYDYGWKAFTSSRHTPKITSKKKADAPTTMKNTTDSRQKCLCGAPNCRGWLDAKKLVA